MEADGCTFCMPDIGATTVQSTVLYHFWYMCDQKYSLYILWISHFIVYHWSYIERHISVSLTFLNIQRSIGSPPSHFEPPTCGLVFTSPEILLSIISIFKVFKFYSYLLIMSFTVLLYIAKNIFQTWHLQIFQVRARSRPQDFIVVLQTEQ